ncbi:GIN domain-containing protein [Terricaulis silvestris]|uniref:Putative auto-transporter adhesin head GIN domain-containing protein n=1 Tax=Terricaulis silvestris TaxID=2686094 RepID=A0A6I6MV04_9CAUL|nr:DUF2807 domain-containing protein [Terricaulis silvestris]QGZ95003.1 hypothetical protein DSM104635_01843 [Terricaulis silvestris]
MERFVFITAVTIAILMGLWAMFGRSNFDFHMDADGRGISPVVELAPGTMAAQTFAGTYLDIRSAAANVTIIPEDRTDFSVEIDNSAGLAPMPTVGVEGENLIIDGQLRGRIHGCDGDSLSLRGYGDVAQNQLPRITIRTPRALDVDRSGAGNTEIGAAESVSLDFSGCGTARIGDVTGDLDLDIAGAGEVTAGAARHVSADVAGAGDITLGAISAGADLDISGAATVTIASLTGDLSTDAAGASEIRINGGSIGTAEIDMAGSGDLEIAANIATMNVSIMGVGDIDVAGTVGDLDVDIAGPGSVTVQAVTGSLQQDIAGPGSVTVTGSARSAPPAPPAAPAAPTP